MQSLNDLYDNQVLELRRGMIVLAVLCELRQPRYGYELSQILSDADMAIDAGTLYPLLRRLEKQGVLDSTWDTTETRPRKYYRLSPPGAELYERLVNEWSRTSTTLQAMIKKGASNE
jgi:PadR family transcriptional regulator, regulatory protein PadR